MHDQDLPRSQQTACEDPDRKGKVLHSAYRRFPSLVSKASVRVQEIPNSVYLLEETLAVSKNALEGSLP